MIIGIDLGTTNSAVAIWRDGSAQLLPNAIGDRLTPSAIGLNDRGELMVGMAARERKSTHPDRTVTAFKRMMGTQAKAHLGRDKLSAEELSALVLRSLKADAEAALGTPVTRAVITVPAYFNDRQRKATRRAGELAGLTVERLLNEPTAAALAHGLADRDDEAPFLVFDLGGGTFDVSIVQIIDGIVEVRASAGDVRLGGEDFNDVLVAMARDRLAGAITAADLPGNALTAILETAAERTRRALTDADTARFEIMLSDAHHGFDVTGDQFEEAAAPLIARLRDPVLRSLRDSGLRAEDLGEVVLVGGGTRMPVVRRAVTRMFGRFPATGINPDEAVALGAAVQAGLRARDAALDEIRLTDVCPFTLGVDTAERDSVGRIRTGIFAPIIERNTIVPASRVETFSTMRDGQREVEFNIFQGEARDVVQNVRLGTVSVPVPARPAGHVAVECRFSYDASGLLEVDVTVPETGTTRQVTIVDDDDAPNADDVAARRDALAKLKVHPREDAANAATLARAERCYQDFIGDYRAHVGGLISRFTTVLDAQEPRAIEAARAELDGELDRIEGDRFL